jgi:arylsulfatase A-like enzyme
VPGERPSVPDDVEPPKYILFWMIDTLRADHLPFYGNEEVEAPHLAKLAAEGARFEIAYSQGNESQVSHASLFTGLYPNRHRLLGRGSLDDDLELLPEALSEADYQTFGYAANGWVHDAKGFDQGWDKLHNSIRQGGQIHAPGIVREALAWIDEHHEEPFFAYLGTIEPHVTYRAHSGIIEKYDEPNYRGKYRNYLSGTKLGAIRGGSVDVTEREKKRIKALYKNEITFNDQAFGKLRAALEEKKIWDQTMVIVTADHGDEFWEHSNVGHGHSLYQELVHVPLLVYYPPLIPEGTVVGAGADLVDLYPTILAALGRERPEGLQGKSLLPLIHGAHGGYPEPAIATQYLLHYAMAMGPWKLYLKKGSFDLYDRASDPLEKKDVAAAHPLASRWLLDAMGWFRAHRKKWDKATWGAPSNLSKGFGAAVLPDRAAASTDGEDGGG